MPTKPGFSIDRAGGETRLRLAGSWTLDSGSEMERSSDQIIGSAAEGRVAILDLSGVERMDTGGAWLIDRARKLLET